MPSASDARQRRVLIRKVSYYTAAFFVAGIFVAVAGAALVALLLGMAGLPFRRTWLVLSVLVIGAAMVVTAVQSWRGK